MTDTSPGPSFRPASISPLLATASPLRFNAIFAAICRPATTSVTMGGGTARLHEFPGLAFSGELTLRLRWSRGFHLFGLDVDDKLVGGWSARRVGEGEAILVHTGVRPGETATTPLLTIIKQSRVANDDAFVASLAGDAEPCRQASIVGWSYS